MPTALVITTAGTNCDHELVLAFEAAGAVTESLHLTQLLEEPALVDRFDLIGLPGGFSYGDAVAAGRITATLMRANLYPALVRAIERGVPMIAPCNGFQVAVQMGLLPGPAVGQGWPATPAAATVALARNASGRFTDRWCRVEFPANSRCVWTQGIEAGDETALLPVAHGEGRFTTGAAGLLEAMEESGQIAVRYVRAENPNGSDGNVAGICDASGLILGLMPHPERYTRWPQHPWWTRLDADDLRAMPPGLAMFRNAVAHAESAAAV